MKNLSMLIALVLVQGCSATSDAEGAGCISPERDGIAYTPISRRNGLICAPPGFPFSLVASANEIGDATARLEQPSDGTLCLSGATSSTAFGFGSLSFGFSLRNADATEVLSAFDAEALGITQIAFTIGTSSPLDLSVELGTVSRFSCPESPSGCSPVPAFGLLTEPGSTELLQITAPGRISAPFARFQQTTLEAGTFDATLLDHLAFVAAGAYDFCVSDLTFLNAEGDPVYP